jgi:hypothetical protein
MPVATAARAKRKLTLRLMWMTVLSVKVIASSKNQTGLPQKAQNTQKGIELVDRKYAYTEVTSKYF